MTVLVVVFHRGFAALRVRRHNVVDGRANDHRQHQHHAARAQQGQQRTGCAAYRARQHRFQPQPSSLQHRVYSAMRGLSNASIGKDRDGIGQSDAVAKHRATRPLLQMAAHRFAREMLAFQRLHFVTIEIGRLDFPLIQRPLPKALAFEGFSLVSGLPQGGIFCFSGLGGVRGWHTLALFLQNPELTVADSSCVQHLALQVLCRVCGFFGNNRLGVFFRRLLFGICCRFRLPRQLLSFGFGFL